MVNRDASIVVKKVVSLKSKVIELEEIYIIFNKKHGKYSAALHVANFFGIERQDIIAIGDDYIDIEMVEKNGLGIVVENVIDEVKNVADIICAHHNKDSLAHWLEENLIN